MNSSPGSFPPTPLFSPRCGVVCCLCALRRKVMTSPCSSSAVMFSLFGQSVSFICSYLAPISLWLPGLCDRALSSSLPASGHIRSPNTHTHTYMHSLYLSLMFKAILVLPTSELSTAKKKKKTNIHWNNLANVTSSVIAIRNFYQNTHQQKHTCLAFTTHTHTHSCVTASVVHPS